MKLCRVLFAAALAGLAGCGSAQPVLLNGSPEGVVVRYSQSGATSEEAVAAARKFCAQYQRNAVAGDSNIATGDTFVSFTCQKP